MVRSHPAPSVSLLSLESMAQILPWEATIADTLVLCLKLGLWREDLRFMSFLGSPLIPHPPSSVLRSMPERLDGSFRVRCL